MKVTDKRMFTPEGELKEEYRFLEERARQRAEAPPDRATERPAGSGAEAAPEHPAGPGAGSTAEARLGPPAGSSAEERRAPPGAAGPGGAPGAGPEGGATAGGAAPAGYEEAAPPGQAPSFFDLLGILAEPIAFYLGDARLPTGESGENLEAARFYIDLLDVLRQKTAGHLAPQEADALEDLLYRLRLRYVQKRR